jgi:hypothetical protein
VNAINSSLPPVRGGKRVDVTVGAEVSVGRGVVVFNEMGVLVSIGGRVAVTLGVGSCVSSVSEGIDGVGGDGVLGLPQANRAKVIKQTRNFFIISSSQIHLAINKPKTESRASWYIPLVCRGA